MPMTNSDARKRLAERHWCNHCAERGIEPVDTLFENVDFTTTLGPDRRIWINPAEGHVHMHGVTITPRELLPATPEENR
jgi:hypothetical protein